MRFLIDMPVTPQAIGHLNAHGHQAVHASSVGLASAADLAVLERARDEGRIVVTADLDYPRLLALQKAESPGIILFRGGSYSDHEMLAMLDRVLAQATEIDIEHAITVVDRASIRRRPLPID